MRQRPVRRVLCRAAAAALLLAGAAPASAYIFNIGNAPRSVFLRVGDGGTATYNNGGGVPGTSSTINEVAVTLQPADVGSGSAVPMSSNGAQLTSSLDGYAFCNAGQVYIGGFVRGGNSSGTLSAAVPATLGNGVGQSIPITQISWTSSGNGDGANAQPIPAGSFTAGTQTLASFAQNTWRESCHSFTYANSAVVSAGSYTARVTYTLSSP